MKTSRLFILIIFLSSFGQVMADLYLPSLPAIKTGLATNFDSVQLSVSLYMFGFAISPLFYGPLSDGIGRRKPLLLGMVICLLGSVICLATPSINFLLLGRLLQGAGAGAGSTLAISILRDCYSPQELAKKSSYMAIGNIAIMVSAPLLGGYIQHYFAWRYNFLFLLLYVFALSVVVFRYFPETNNDLHIDHIKPKNLAKNVWLTLTNKSLMRLGFMVMCSYGGVMALAVEGPIVIQHNLGYSALVFGWLSLANGISYIIFSLTNARLIDKLSMQILSRCGLAVMLTSGAAMLVFSLYHYINLWTVVIPITLYVGGIGMFFPNCFAMAAPHYSKTAGLGGAVMRTMQILGGALVGTLLAHIPQKSALVLAIALVGTTMIALILAANLPKPVQD